MALFWETSQPVPSKQAAPLSPLAIALLLKLRAESDR
jgi:hypothetical protein